MSEKNNRIATIDNAIDILLILSNQSGKSIRELGNELNISKSTLHRTLQTLESRNFVKQDLITEKYSLGYQILALSTSLKKQTEIRNIAYKHMVDLRNLAGDTVQLAILDGEEILVVEAIEGTNVLRIFSQPGQKHPITYGNFGKIFLAYMNTKKVKELIEKYPPTKNAAASITNKEDYLEKVKEVKKKGISTSVDDPIDGAVSMAVPIFDQNDNLIASLAIVGAKTLTNLDNLEKLERLTKDCGEKISKDVQKA